MTETMECWATGETLTKAEAPRDEWKMPTPPDCEICGYDEDTDEIVDPVRCVPFASMEDAWCLSWLCPECDEAYGHGDEIPWPFRQDEFATKDQLAALGFQVGT